MKYLLYDNTGWFGIQLTKILRSNRIKYYIGKSSSDIHLITQEIDEIKPTHIIAFRKINIDFNLR